MNLATQRAFRDYGLGHFELQIIFVNTFAYGNRRMTTAISYQSSQ
jgi:hypothetical protein